MSEEVPAVARPSRLRQSVSEATERIQEIIDAAEHVAAGIQADAEAEAARYLEQRKREADRRGEERARALASLTSTLADQVEQFKRHTDQLVGALEETTAAIRAATADEAEADVASRGIMGSIQRVIGGGGGGEPPEEWEEDRVAGAAARHDPLAGPQSTVPEPPPPAIRPGALSVINEIPEEALLRATQMAVAGRSRFEIESALNSEFGVTDVGPLLDELLNPAAERFQP